MNDAVSEAALDRFCGDKNRAYLQLKKLISKFILISKFSGVGHTENAKQLLHHHINLNKHVDREAFLGSSMLENSPHQVIYSKYTKSLMLIWETGS